MLQSGKPVIGLVLNNTPGYSETFFHNKIRFLQEEGYRVIVFAKNVTTCPDDWEVVPPYPMSKNAGVRSVYLLLTLLWLMLRVPLRVLRFIGLEKTIRKDWRTIIENVYINAHILTHKVDWLHFGFAAIALRRENVAAAMRAKMAVSIRGYDIAVYPLKHKDCYKNMWPRVHKVHTISDDLINLAYTRGLPKDKIVSKITPAIDVDKFTVNRSGNFKRPVTIVTTSRLNWKKGHLYALHAMKLLKENNVDFKYILIGEGEEEYNLVFETYQLGLDDNVVFAGKASHEEVKNYLSESDIYLQPSVQEGFCNAVLEAQAAGLFCIVTDAEGLSENVLNDKTGFVIPKRDPVAIANAILKVLNMSQEERKGILLTAAERVKREFNLQKQKEEFVEFYK